MPKRSLVAYIDEEGEHGMVRARGQIAWHPFESDYNDHFETSDEAVQDVAHIVSALARSLGKRPEDLKIYDPYYCAGNIKDTWRRCGFPQCYNENLDCYAEWANGTEPEYDVIVTNPPFSGEHKEWCIDYCVKSGKPWLLLLPNYCATKNYFSTLTEGHPTFFAIPEAVYQFVHPEGTGHEDCPFHSIWMGSFREKQVNVLSAARRVYTATVKIEESIAKLKQDNIVPGKRPNPKQRKKLRAMQG